MTSIVSHAELLEALDYSPSTGIFKWKRNSPRARIGSVAGSANNKGYLYITLNGKVYSAHALAWFYVNQVWAVGNIDHINNVRTDDRIINLRLATNQENHRNRSLSSQNKLGYKGVRAGKNGKYVARIFVDAKERHLGTFATPELAAEAYDAAAKILFGSFALTNRDMGNLI